MVRDAHHIAARIFVVAATAGVEIEALAAGAIAAAIGFASDYGTRRAAEDGTGGRATGPAGHGTANDGASARAEQTADKAAILRLGLGSGTGHEKSSGKGKVTDHGVPQIGSAAKRLGGVLKLNRGVLRAARIFQAAFPDVPLRRALFGFAAFLAATG
jgi:hypothetical protein